MLPRFRFLMVVVCVSRWAASTVEFVSPCIVVALLALLLVLGWVCVVPVTWLTSARLPPSATAPVYVCIDIRACSGARYRLASTDSVSSSCVYARSMTSDMLGFGCWLTSGGLASSISSSSIPIAARSVKGPWLVFDYRLTSVSSPVLSTTTYPGGFWD